MLHNIPTNYNGTLYPSKAEAMYAEYLDSLLKNKQIKWWKRQVRFQVEGDKRYTVIADFLVFSEREEIHEVKRGYYSQEFIYKSQLWLEQYPSFPYYVFEPTATGWSKTPLAEFIKPYILIQPDSQPRKFSKFEFLLGKFLHHLGEFLYARIR
jgi:hypothetical protein